MKDFTPSQAIKVYLGVSLQELKEFKLACKGDEWTMYGKQALQLLKEGRA